MAYKESAKVLDGIRRKYGDVMFRLGVYHMLDVGIRNLTDEIVERTCSQILKQDDSKSGMTNEFRCDIVRCAAEISKTDTTDILIYIGDNLEFDTGDTVDEEEME